MTRLAVALLWLAHFLPSGRSRSSARRRGAVLAFWLIAERRRVTRINLEKCFPGACRRPSGRRWRGRTSAPSAAALVDRALLWWAPRARIERLVRIEGLEHLRALRGAPAILLVPHFVGPGRGRDAPGLRDRTATSMYARQKNAQFDALLQPRPQPLRRPAHASRARRHPRRRCRAMREGRPFYYLPDQDYGPRDAIFVPFFGVPAATDPGPVAHRARRPARGAALRDAHAARRRGLRAAHRAAVGQFPHR